MRREGRFRTVCCLLVVVAFLTSVPVAHSQVGRTAALSLHAARTTDLAREGAMRRLRTPACQQVLSDFKDDKGRSLAENLAPFGVPADEYLAQIPFLDGSGHRLCTGGQSQLLTTQGVARVFVCEPFLRTVRNQRDEAEVYVIHEMLHTLGLGENPPSSLEITQQVKRRCAP